MQRALESRAFISAILAMVTGTVLFYTYPFPGDQIFLHVIALHAPQAFLSFKCLYYALLFTTPYFVSSTALSGLYIFTLRARRKVSPGRLPEYPDPRSRRDLFLVLGEVHNPRKPVPAEAPSWLTIPERGLFTGIAILGAIGSGKTSCCMLPFAEQILAYRAVDQTKRIGGLVLEVKGDFCRKVTRHSWTPRPRRGLHGNQSRFRILLQPSSQRLGRVCSRVQHCFTAQQSLWARQRAVLATGVHQPCKIHHPASQGRVRLRHAVRCLPVRDLSTASRRTDSGGRRNHSLAATTWPSRRRFTANVPLTLRALDLFTTRRKNAISRQPRPSCSKYLRARRIPSEARTVLDPSQANAEKTIATRKLFVAGSMTTGEESSRNCDLPL